MKNLPLENFSFRFSVDLFELNPGWLNFFFSPILLRLQTINKNVSSSLSLNSPSSEVQSSCIAFSAIPFFKLSPSSSLRWISCVKSFPRRSSSSTFLRSWASLITVTFGPHLFFGRHQRIFLTISSFELVLPSDFKLFVMSVNLVNMSFVDLSICNLKNSYWCMNMFNFVSQTSLSLHKWLWICSKSV